MKHESTTVNGIELPTPGDWSVNWVEGDVVAYRWGDEGDRIHDGATAHVFGAGGKGLGDELRYQVEVGDVRAEIVADVDDQTEAWEAIGDILVEYAPDGGE